MPERIVEQCIDGDWVCLGCVTDENAQLNTITCSDHHILVEILVDSQRRTIPLSLVLVNVRGRWRNNFDRRSVYRVTEKGQ